MKTLQNNFTTPEQSMRLLELGVPADSADCFYIDKTSRIFVAWQYGILTDPVVIDHKNSFIPCWSVGRLMEIFEICTGLVWENAVIDGYSKIDILLEDFEDTEKKYMFNFSKLED